MRAGIVDYRMGNLASVAKALELAGASSKVSENHEDLADSDVLVLPGVGNFTAGMNNLRKAGLIEFVKHWAASGMPLIGICLGMQLLFEHSDEGDTAGLGILRGPVTRLSDGLKVPHMGWNQINSSSSALFEPFIGKYFYFVHSYICKPEPSIPAAKTSYGKEFVSAVENGKILGFQFHPEKSSSEGLSLLRSALEVYR